MFLSILLAAASMADTPHPPSPTATETVIVADKDKAGEKQPVKKSKYEVPMAKPSVTEHKVTWREGK